MQIPDISFANLPNINWDSLNWDTLNWDNLRATVPVDVYVYASIILLSILIYFGLRARSTSMPKQEKPIEDDYVVLNVDSDDEEPKPTLLKSRDKASEKVSETFEVKQPYDAYLVIDIEGTCELGSSYDYPNEIIELPIVLLTWTATTTDGQQCLRVMDEFTTFVRPTWRPLLSHFCTELTGIHQSQVDAAPTFPEIIPPIKAFLARNGLLNAKTGERLVRFCWVTDGPFDIRDFVVKQCFISKIPMPDIFQGDALDVRRAFMDWKWFTSANPLTSVKVLSIPKQLSVLRLEGFQGRRHSGIDDARNLARVVIELAKRGVTLRPNTVVRPNKRWKWMGKSGKILEDEIVS